MSNFEIIEVHTTYIRRKIMETQLNDEVIKEMIEQAPETDVVLDDEVIKTMMEENND